MSCKKWEESIYLHNELTEAARGELDIHLLQCAECALLFQNVRQMQVAIKDLSGRKALVRDSTLLTNKIIRSLPSTASDTRVTSAFATLMDSLLTRYLLGAVSLVLIFFFVNEQQRKISTPKQEIV